MTMIDTDNATKLKKSKTHLFREDPLPPGAIMIGSEGVGANALNMESVNTPPMPVFIVVMPLLFVVTAPNILPAPPPPPPILPCILLFDTKMIDGSLSTNLMYQK